MKKAIILIIAITLLSLQLVPAFALPPKVLSEMSESECIEFVKQYNIEIPNDYTEEMWAPFVKEVIQIVDANPDYEFAFNYTVTQEFANAIKEAVNDYNGIIANRTAAQPTREYSALASIYILQDSTQVTAWMPQFEDFNCYVYSIETPEQVWVDPGYWSDQSFDLSMSILTIADLAIDDLKALDHERVYSTSTMDTTNLCTNEKIICVRRGTYDYHFMRFDDGDWYHKPADSTILRYDYIPSVMRVWSNERVVGNEAIAPTIYYDSNIIYISYDGHDWQYTYYGNNYHRKQCDICGDIFTEACEFEYSYAGDGMHTATCVDCGHTITSACSSFATTSNGDRTHDISCTVCGNAETEVCRLEYTNLTNTTHSASCTECDYVIASQDCQLNYRKNDGQTHTVSCTNCENRRTQNCSHRYVSHGDNTHSYLCSMCDYVKNDHAACLFDASNICRICGAPKNGAVINKQEEITPE